MFCCFFTYFCLVFHWPVSFLTLTLVSVSRVVVNTGWNVIYHHISAKQNTLERFFKKVFLRQTLVYTSHLQLFRSWAQLPKTTDTLESAYCAYVLSNCRRIVQRLVWIIQFIFATRWWNSGEGGRGDEKEEMLFNVRLDMSARLLTFPSYSPLYTGLPTWAVTFFNRYCS